MSATPDMAESNIPDRLPRLDAGYHAEDSGQACAMEAAAWLAGEKWSDRPVSVHRAIARVARIVNDEVPDQVRQTLWPLIISSLDTKGSFHLLLSMRLGRRCRNALESARLSGDIRQAWVEALEAHRQLFGAHAPYLLLSRLRSLSGHLEASRRGGS